MTLLSLSKTVIFLPLNACFSAQSIGGTVGFVSYDFIFFENGRNFDY